MNEAPEGSRLRFASAEREAWTRDGWIVREGVFAEAELRALRDAVEDVVARVAARASRKGASAEHHLADGHRIQFSSRSGIQWEWQEGSREIRLIEPFTHLDERFERLWGEPRFRAPMQDALGVDAVAPYTCKLNLKRPREGSEFPWHQDYPYWYAFTPETAHQIATVVLFLDDASVENGAMRVLPGSHRRGPAPRDPKDPTRFLADPACIDTSCERAVEVKAGGLLFLPSLLLHRSSANASSLQRRAILLSYQAAGRPLQRDLEWRPERVEALP